MWLMTIDARNSICIESETVTVLDIRIYLVYHALLPDKAHNLVSPIPLCPNYRNESGTNQPIETST